MSKRERTTKAKKDVKRLQLRREVIRTLATESLGQVAGGLVKRPSDYCQCQCTDVSGSWCKPSV